ncbi:MAG: beta-glucuronidase, partial [Clostridiaceae bacterium]|nr:beta-glucuronidase [Clostridiaceae bacterium]
MLYPIRTQTRYLESLDGIWQLRFEKDGYKADPSKPLTGGYSIAVPGSFNDQLTIHELRHFAGYMVYEREFFVDANILAQRPVLRFGSVTHNCEVFINGKLVAEHRGGFTPFEADLTDQLELGSNRVTVRVNNLLDHSTLPVGNLKTWEDEDGNIYYKVDENFDFFNYAGIHR